MVWASRSSLTTLCRRLTRKARRAAERRFFSPCGLQYKTSNIKLLHITLPPLFASVCVCTYVCIHLTHTHAFSITHTQSLRARAISLSLLSLSVCLFSTPAPPLCPKHLPALRASRAARNFWTTMWSVSILCVMIEANVMLSTVSRSIRTFETCV